jgi:DNA-directed RNA polymerase subunit RPC12/RpoP
MDEPTPEPGASSDSTTLVSLLGALAGAGYTGDFFVTAEGLLRCGTCRADVEPAGLELDELRRIEGASDPSDMAAVLGITCPHCGQRGTAIVRYGPEAEPQESEMLLALEDHRYPHG